jgi:hypothetical protein
MAGLRDTAGRGRAEELIETARAVDHPPAGIAVRDGHALLDGRTCRRSPQLQRRRQDYCCRQRLRSAAWFRELACRCEYQYRARATRNRVVTRPACTRSRPWKPLSAKKSRNFSSRHHANVSRPVNEKQRRRMSFTARPLVDQFEHWSVPPITIAAP